MSLIQTVVAMVEEEGQATADDLFSILKDEGKTREQVIRALQNARASGFLLSSGREPRRGKGAGCGTECTTYRINHDRPEVIPNREAQRRAKLNEDAVASIRASQDKSRDLAMRFGVTPSQINRIRSGAQWVQPAAPWRPVMPRVSSVWQLGGMA